MKREEPAELKTSAELNLSQLLLDFELALRCPLVLKNITPLHVIAHLLYNIKSSGSKLINPEDWLTVKYNVIVLEVLPLLVPFWIPVENDSHCLSAGQPSVEMLSVMESDTASTKRRYSISLWKMRKEIQCQRLLTHWPQTLWSCCQLLWRRNRFFSSAEEELCKDRHHPRRSLSSWSPHSTEVTHGQHNHTQPHWMMKSKQSQLCSLLLTCEMALNALVLPNFSPSLERDSAECIAVFAAPSTPSLIFLPISVRLTSSSPYSHSGRTFTDTMTDLSTVCNWLQKPRGIFFPTYLQGFYRSRF